MSYSNSVVTFVAARMCRNDVRFAFKQDRFHENISRTSTSQTDVMSQLFLWHVFDDLALFKDARQQVRLGIDNARTTQGGRDSNLPASHAHRSPRRQDEISRSARESSSFARRNYLLLTSNCCRHSFLCICRKRVLDSQLLQPIQPIRRSTTPHLSCELQLRDSWPGAIERQ